MIKIIQFTFNPISENTYVAYDETNECVIIDAGNSNNNENRTLQDAIAQRGLKPVKLIDTHGHFDHVMGSAFVCRTYKIETYINKNEIKNLQHAVSFGSYFNIDIEEPCKPQHFIDEGDKISFGKSEFSVLFTPGHTPGGVCFYSAADELLFSGDTIFAGSIGRTDLPGGDYDIIKKSVKRLMTLPENTNVFCGHGPRTTIGREKNSNPFITEMDTFNEIKDFD